MGRIGRREPRPEEPRPAKTDKLRKAFVEDFLCHLDEMSDGDSITFSKENGLYSIVSVSGDGYKVEGKADTPEVAFFEDQ